MKNTILILGLIVMLSGCGDDNKRYWNVTMGDTRSVATFSLGTPLAAGTSIVPGASTNTATSPYNFFLSGGNTQCQTVYIGGTAVVEAGAKTGTINFRGYCGGFFTSDLQITLGNSTAAIKDADGNTIVEAGRSVTATISVPGTTGNTTGNIYY